MVILKNQAKCLKCGDIVRSFTRHDFQKCKCGNTFVDGGTDYFRCTIDDTLNMSECISSFETLVPAEIRLLMDDIEWWNNHYKDEPEGLNELNRRFVKRFIPRIKKYADRIEELEKENKELKMKVIPVNPFDFWQ